MKKYHYAGGKNNRGRSGNIVNQEYLKKAAHQVTELHQKQKSYKKVTIQEERKVSDEVKIQ